MVVESTLTALVEHFSQPIHQKTGKEEKEAPHFDELLGCPPEISPVVQHWLDHLQHKASQCDMNNNDDTRLSWLKGYVRHIRPVLFCADNNQISPSGVPVLQQFELVLSQWQQQPQKQPQKHHDTISHTLKTLANDISLLTEACSHDDDDYYYSCRNMVLPTLLRLLAHGIPYSREKDDDDARRICAVALLLFGHSTIDPRHVEPSLLAESCLWQNVSYQDLSVDIGNNNWIDWTQVELVGTAWDDPVTGIATRAAQHGWKALLRVLLLRADNKEMTCCCTDQVDWKRQVLQELGMSEMACAVRAHFFGRDDNHVLTTTTTTLSSSASTTPLSQRQYLHHRPNKYPLELKPTKAPNDSFQKRPSRVHVALHFISLVTATNSRDDYSHVLEHVLPICYALLDYSTTLKHVAMGAAALLHLFQIMNTTTIAANADFKYWTDCKEMLLLDVLERACRTTREGPAVFLVCLAQSRVFTIFPHRTKERRRATQHLLTILHRNSYSQNNDSLHLGLLMGGIIPLLQQHANYNEMQQQEAAVPDADAMELGRLGLVTLLPLLRWNSSSSTRVVQLPALVALIHLMMGAYPILPRHGGKIMCELLACLGHAADDDDGEQEISIIPMATTAAAIALVLSGERASAILELVKPDEFDPMLVRYAQAIREEATRLRKEHKAIQSTSR